MEKNTGYKPKQNRSSIIRIILSNYDMAGLKELKVLYQKQGGVDTFNLETNIDLDSRNVIIKNFKAKEKERYRYGFLYDNHEKFTGNKNSLVVTKFDKILNKDIRKYEIILSLKEKTSNVILAQIKDVMEEPIKSDGEKDGKRKKLRNISSQTERKLLSPDVCKNYSQIARVSMKDIDSLKIYKIKRFLNYRSNLLMYFALINDFLCTPIKDDNITEVWKLSGDKSKLTEEKLEKIGDHVYNTLSKEIENRINQLKKKFDKNSREIQELENLHKKNRILIKELDDKKSSDNTKEIKSLKKDNNEYKRKIDDLKQKNIKLDLKKTELSQYSSKENLKIDLKKILDIFSEFRHALMHYDYMYFENIFENRENKTLADLLNLNFFKYTKFIEEFKVENKTNYLDGEEKLSVLGKTKNIKKLYSYYNTLCSSKSGFNKFINAFFTCDGVEDSNFKDLITEKFKNEMEIISNSIKKNTNSKKNTKQSEKNLKQMKKHLELLKTPYFWDIHISQIYKDLYNKRKNLIDDYNKEINGIKSKTRITNINSELLKLKQEMEEITKNNSLYRLKYKLQMAYAFLMIEFKGDLNRFKNEFNPTDLKKIQEYLGKKEKYLDFRVPEVEKWEKSEFDLGILETQLKKLQEKSNEKNGLYLDVDSKNNLFKFYILTYLMLPIEFKGDFLGFVKTHYYNIKNVDFLDESDDNLNDEKLNEKLKELKDDSFFHKIRLFEKNIKNYEVIKYSISTHEDIKKYFELLGLDVKHLEYRSTDEVGIFNKNTVLPIFKYYQNVFKLYNDVEIHGLLKVGEIRGENLEQALDYVKGNGNLNFGKLLEKINKNSAKGHSSMRNSIAHLDYKDLFTSLLKNELKLNEKVRGMIEFSQESGLNKINLGMDFINDYYMKKERFIFNQRRLIPGDIIDTKRDLKKKKNDELMKTYNLIIDSNNLNNIYEYSIKLKNIADGIESLEENRNLFNSIKIDNKPFLKLEEKERNKILIKDSSDLMGIYKEQVIRKLKNEVIKKFIYNEEKIITINVYKATIGKIEPFIIKAIRDKDNKRYVIDNKSILENEYYLCNEKDSVVTVIPKHSNKKIEFNFDLNNGYLFGKTIIYGTKNTVD